MNEKKKDFLISKITELEMMENSIRQDDIVSKIQLEQLIADFKEQLAELE